MGYQTLDAFRPRFGGKPPTPVVDIALVRRPVDQVKEARRGRPANARLEPEIIAQIIALRERGEGIRTICSKLSITGPSVRKYAGHVPPPEGGWRQGGTPKTPRNKAFAERLKRAGFTYAEIAEELGCCESQAYYTLNRRRYRGGTCSPVARIVQDVSRATGIHSTDLRKAKDVACGRGNPEVGKARHILFWIARKYLKKNSTLVIGRSLGGFDHSSVLYGMRRVDGVIARLGIKTEGRAVRVARALWAADWSVPKTASENH